MNGDWNLQSCDRGDCREDVYEMPGEPHVRVSMSDHGDDHETRVYCSRECASLDLGGDDHAE